MENNTDRLLVIGGGGARGAWGAGYAKYLTVQNQQTYKHVFGTSTGSLMASMIVLNDFTTLKEVYTSVTQSSIFNLNPFNADGTLKKLNAIWRLVKGKKTFGESRNLRDLIAKFLTPERYLQIINTPGCAFTVCALNYRTGELVYTTSAAAVPYIDMINWIWASANEPLFMSFTDAPDLEGGPFVDGGVKQNVPIIQSMKYAKGQNIKDIDIVINKPIDPLINKTFQPAGILANLLRLIEFWETEVRNSNIIMAKLLSRLDEAELPPVGLGELEKIPGTPFNLNFHFIPLDVYAENVNELIFDKQKMTAMWEAGERGEEDQLAVRTYRIHESQLKSLEIVER